MSEAKDTLLKLESQVTEAINSAVEARSGDNQRWQFVAGMLLQLLEAIISKHNPAALTDQAGGQGIEPAEEAPAETEAPTAPDDEDEEETPHPRGRGGRHRR